MKPSGSDSLEDDADEDAESLRTSHLRVRYALRFRKRRTKMPTSEFKLTFRMTQDGLSS